MKLFRIFGMIITILVLGGFIAYQVLDEDLPEGKEGPEAESLADRMLLAVNKSAFDTLQFISWTYPGGHNYQWDREAGHVIVAWDDYEVDLDLTTLKGEITENGTTIESDEISRRAYEFFINDSFWLVAPFKIRDPGTTRKLVRTDNGDALLVTYNEGGVTPGDSYLWILDENGLPKSWKFWVQIIPVGGIEFGWTDWNEYNGAWLASTRVGPITLDIEIHEVK